MSDLRAQIVEGLRSVCLSHPDDRPCIQCNMRANAVLGKLEPALEARRSHSQHLIRLHEEAQQRAEKAEAELARLRELAEHLPDAHAKLRLIEDGDREGCADWCYACRLEKAGSAVDRVRAIPRLPRTSDQRGVRGRAYTRGWQSVIDIIDAALAEPHPATGQPNT